MLPRALLQLITRLEGDRIVPQYFTERDHPWLSVLIDEHARFEGRKRSELEARLKQPLPRPAPRAKLRVAARVLESMTKDRASSAVPPSEARWRVFRAAAAMGAERDVVLGSIAAEMDISVGELEKALFADLRAERRVPALPPDTTPSSLALRSNLTIASALLRRAATVRIVLFGNARALIRHAKLAGLICKVECLVTSSRRLAAGIDPRHLTVVAAEDELMEGAVVEVSGPLALFHRTEVYGRALASLVPRIAWCSEFELTAKCALGQSRNFSTFVLRSGDPIGAGDELKRPDSRVEKRFVAEFGRAAPDWEVIREPRALSVCDGLVFPDLELVHRGDSRRRWLLELVGFWTAEYLAEKLERLQVAGFERVILCVDERRRCGDQMPPKDAQVLTYKGKIDARAVLAKVAP